MQDNQLMSLLAAIFYTNPASVMPLMQPGTQDDQELIRRSFAKAVDFHQRGHSVIQALIQARQAQMEAEQNRENQGHDDA